MLPPVFSGRPRTDEDYGGLASATVAGRLAVCLATLSGQLDSDQLPRLLTQLRRAWRHLRCQPFLPASSRAGPARLSLRVALCRRPRQVE
uniref:Transcriptional regulator n=1 Tax=Macrostomum lignano TaxID=282301 RepID=A0A1I8JND9_9PLAT